MNSEKVYINTTSATNTSTLFIISTPIFNSIDTVNKDSADREDVGFALRVISLLSMNAITSVTALACIPSALNASRLISMSACYVDI